MAAFPVERGTAPVTPAEVFTVSAFGSKNVNGVPFDFDAFQRELVAPALEEIGLHVRRADQPFWNTGLWPTIKTGIERAQLVLVDFSGPSTNVAAEYVASMYLGKRILIITQNPEDIPSDLRGERYILYPADLNAIKIRVFLDQLKAQARAMLEEPAEELEPTPLANFSSTEAAGTVDSVGKDVAVVRLDDGEYTLLRGKEIDWSRNYADLTKRLSVGGRLEGRLMHDPRTRTTKFTLLNYKDGNPWTYIQQTMAPGQVIEQVPVLRVSPGVGAFVRVHGEVNGLIRESTMRGKQPRPGDRVDVVVTAIKAEERRVSLELRSVHASRPEQQRGTNGGRTAPSPTATPPTLPPVGFADWGVVKHIAPSAPGKAGFALIELPGFERAVMLLSKDMSPDLRADFDRGELKVREEELYVRVKSVDLARSKVLVEDVDEPDDQQVEGLTVVAVGDVTIHAA